MLQGTATSVTVDGQRFAGTVRFDSANTYTLGGTGPLTIRTVGAVTGGFEVLNGSHTVSAPVELWSNTTLNVGPAASVLTLSGPITTRPNVTVTKTGSGRADVSSINATGLTVSSGTLRVLSNGTSAGTSNVRTLSIAGGATPTAKLDLTNNALVVITMRQTQARWHDPITNQVCVRERRLERQRDHQLECRRGHPRRRLRRTLRINQCPGDLRLSRCRCRAAALHALWRLESRRHGQPAGLQQAGGELQRDEQSWSDGDFNYDGNVNLLDFNKLAANFNLSATGVNGQPTPQDWANLAAAVPEPATGAFCS